MSDLDPIVQEILLEGDSEIVRALDELGEKGSEAIKKLSEAAEKGAGGFDLFSIGVTSLVGAVSLAAVALAHFVETQDEAVQKTQFLADAMGTSAAAVEGIEQAFAAAGVSAQTFERFAQRLTTTIAQQWPHIAASIRTSATQSESAQEQMVSATLRVKAAQDNLSLGAEEDANKIAAANQHVAQTYLSLQEIIQKQANERVRADQSLIGATNSVEAAEQRLRTLQGNPPSAAEKQALEIRQAEAAVDAAREAQVEAAQAKANQAAEQKQKLAAAELADDNARMERQKLILELQSAQTKRTNEVAEAETHVAEQAEKNAQLQLTQIPRIATALGGVVTGNKEVAKSIDLTQVSVRNLSDGILALAAQTNKVEQPNGAQAFKEFATVLQAAKKAGTEYLTEAQQLDLVQQLVNRGMGQGSVAASDLLHALQHGPEYFDKYVEAAKKHISTQKEGTEAAEEFKKAFESFDQQLQLTNRDLSVLASPALISFFNTLKESLTEEGGVLHTFVDGIKGAGTAITAVVEAFQGLGAQIEKSFNLKQGTAMEAILIVLGTLVLAFSSAWIVIPVAIALTIEAIGKVRDNLKGLQQYIEENRLKFILTATALAGIIALMFPWATALGLIAAGVVLIYENWDKIKQAVSDTWDSFKTSALSSIKSVMGYLDGIVDKLRAIRDAAPKWMGGGGGEQSAAGGSGGVNADGTSKNADNSFAGGGEVHGPGSHTSDSIVARLSRGEFVMKAAAVQQFGASFMHAINNGYMPGFAAGGLVPSPVRLAGTSSMPATSTLNLSIDGRSFGGLRGPKSTVDDLTSFAISRQTSQAGNKPSWYK